METYGFFNAERLPNGNFDRVYLADSFARYFASFISNGVFGGKMSSLQVILSGSFGVSVQNGQGFINGYWYENDTTVGFTLQASSSLPRIDTVVLRLDFVTRSVRLAMLTGTPSTSPVAPALTRNENTWELGLADIDIAENATAITAQEIIDTRLDTARCGFVHGVVDQLDTTEYGNRLNGFIENFISQANGEFSGFTEGLGTLSGQANSEFSDFKESLDTVGANAQEYFDENFAAPLNNLVANANTLYTETFLPNLSTTQELATGAYEDFLEWIVDKKNITMQQLADLVDQMESIISSGDIGSLLVRIDTLEENALTANDVIDALDSSETTKALSANQGRVLEEALDDKVDKAIPSAIGNLAMLGEHGELLDSGFPSAVPRGSAGGDLSGSFPNPTLATLTPETTPSSQTLEYGGIFTSDEVTTDTKGRVLGIFRRTQTLPDVPFNVYETEEEAEADESGMLALFPVE
jgi:hypothetical protein